MVTEAMLAVRGETLRLLPERAVYWPGASTLFVADVHLGKTATHNAYGRALPQADTADDLARLTSALERTQARTLIVLGDLIHAAKGRDALTLQAFETWRQAHPALEIRLIRGNHDRGADAPENWRLITLDGPAPLAPFVLSHAPIDSESDYVLSGHLHPGVELKGRGRQLLRLPCFWFAENAAVLPAFGGFTGLSMVRPQIGDRLFAITSRSVIPVTPSPGTGEGAGG
jgi:DNA ligase-associated metallophosphoesterase